MRHSDVWQAPQAPYYIRDEKKYISTDKPLEEMSLDELKRVLCGKANGDVLACESCESKCKFGRRITELLQPVEAQESQQKNENRVQNYRKLGLKNGMMRHEKSENAYLHAIASGNPKQWFIDHGRHVGNGMTRMRKRFGNMTAEEAKERLAAKGGGDDILVPAKKPEQTHPADTEKARPVESAPVAPVCNTLKIVVVRGRCFTYERDDENLVITVGESSVKIPFGDVDVLCAEIKRAAAMMAESE